MSLFVNQFMDRFSLRYNKIHINCRCSWPVRVRELLKNLLGSFWRSIVVFSCLLCACVCLTAQSEDRLQQKWSRDIHTHLLPALLGEDPFPSKHTPQPEGQSDRSSSACFHTTKNTRGHKNTYVHTKGVFTLGRCNTLANWLNDAKRTRHQLMISCKPGFVSETCSSLKVFNKVLCFLKSDGMFLLSIFLWLNVLAA